MCSEDEMEVEEMEAEDTAASMSATETEDYPGSADEDDEAHVEQTMSRVRLPGGMSQLCLLEVETSILTIDD